MVRGGHCRSQARTREIARHSPPFIHVKQHRGPILSIIAAWQSAIAVTSQHPSAGTAIYTPAPAWISTTHASESAGPLSKVLMNSLCTRFDSADASSSHSPTSSASPSSNASAVTQHVLRQHAGRAQARLDGQTALHEPRSSSSRCKSFIAWL